MSSVAQSMRVSPMMAPSAAGEIAAWPQDEYFGFVLGRRIALPFRPLKGARKFLSVEPTATELKALREAGLVPFALEPGQ